tara:strand:+ start:501 stop:1064 length:564 start_codon:yes stop_codon:yes gene_type:complete
LKIFLATNNNNKKIEIKSIFGSISNEFEIVDDYFTDIEETSDTLEGNALLKAEHGYKQSGIPTISDDTGLFVPALGNEPGVKSKRYFSETATDEENLNFLLSNLDEDSDRTAYFKTVVCFSDGKNVIFEEGKIEGQISKAPLGNNGFGYDPIFVFNGRTLAQMDSNEKNEISHRKVAFMKIAKALLR